MSDANSPEDGPRPGEGDGGVSRENTKRTRPEWLNKLAQHTRARMRGVFGGENRSEPPAIAETPDIPLGSDKPINTRETPLNPQVALTDQLRQVFGEDRIRRTNEHAATPEDVMGVITALDDIMKDRKRVRGFSSHVEPSIVYKRKNQPTVDDELGFKNNIRVDYYPYEDEHAYEDAHKDTQGRPYRGEISNLVLETDGRGHVAAREHFFIDRDNNAYISRTIMTRKGEVTEVIPASYQDTVRAFDTIHGKFLPLDNKFDEQSRKTPDDHEELAMAVRYIEQYKKALSANPAFVEGVVQKHPDTDQEKALAEFWHGSGESVTCFVGDRLLEVAYLKDIADMDGGTLPNTPNGYETMHINLHPGDNARFIQSLTLTTKPLKPGQTMDGKVHYSEIQLDGGAYHVSSVGIDDEDPDEDPEEVLKEQEQTARGAETLLQTMNGQDPVSVFGMDIDGEASDDEKRFFVADYAMYINAPVGTPREEYIRKAPLPYLRDMGRPTPDKPIIDERLDRPFEPPVNAFQNRREKNNQGRRGFKFRRK